MIQKFKSIIGMVIVLSMIVLLCVSFLPSVSKTAAQKTSGINIDPAADVHPSVILEGRVTVGPYTKIDAGTIITGNVTIGHHTLIRCNVTIRGTNVIGNYTHIYDNVNIEGDRPAKVGSSRAEVPDRSIIGDGCWINHGATMHGTQVGDGGAIGLNACCDYNTRIGICAGDIDHQIRFWAGAAEKHLSRIGWIQKLKGILNLTFQKLIHTVSIDLPLLQGV